MASSPVQGAQVVSRVAALLRLVSRTPRGAALTELVRDSGLTRPTVHRLLASLAAEGLVENDPATKSWLLGPEIQVLGAVAAARFPLDDIVQPGLRRLAEETGESAFFSVRRGNDAVCLMREEGSFPVRSFVLYEGVRFPLGVASAGTAIMAFLSEEEREQIFAEGDERTAAFGPSHTVAAIRAHLEMTRITGYAVNPGLILEGSWGMGAAVFDQNGRATYALSLTGIESRFREERRDFLGGLLLEEAHRISTQFHPGRD